MSIRTIRALNILVLSLILAPTARAQIKPKIYIVFDTSDSMTEYDGNSYDGHNGNDGSLLCGSTGQSSSIYQLKVAFMEVLQGMGAQEMDFALATFPQVIDPTRAPLCGSAPSCNGLPPAACSGHYTITTAQKDGLDACKVTGHDPATQQTSSCATSACPWYASFKSEVLRVPFAGTTPEQVMLHFDQKEDAGTLPSGQPLANPEVRAIGEAWTPLGKSLFYAHGYFDQEVVLPASDYRKPCEKLTIALFTDGLETCDVQGGDPFSPTLWASNLWSNLKVVTHTVAIGSTGQLLADIAAAGHGKYYPVGGNTAALKAAFLDILADSQPPQETCNGADDDCDNQIDEDFPLKGQPCNNGKLGVCFKPGTYVCKGDGTGVICNAPDATGTAETCNNLDDDCDGQIDEDLPNCIPFCQPEICNGLDDDCDGATDEEIPQVPCGSEVGECKAGLTKCVGGALICDGGTPPKPEECNGLDDDCDNMRDGMSQPCYTFASGCDLQTGLCQGICKLGNRLCTAVQTGGVWEGKWGSCVGEVGPQTEICDGIDNNCDGTIDENAECPGASVCIEGACSPPCTAGEFVCPSGLICKNGWCVPDPCSATDCTDKGWICKGGECINPCANVTCGDLEECRLGVCVDLSCYSPANRCPDGQRCIKAVCQEDPCRASAVTCASDSYCMDGICLRLCEFTPCRPGEVCKVVGEGNDRQNRCVADPCASLVCPKNEVCVAGKCQLNPCSGISCARGESCVGGVCTRDLCEVTVCPPGYRCALGNCLMDNVIGTTELLASGAGGCACSLAESREPAGLLLPLLLGLLLLARSRRRTR